VTFRGDESDNSTGGKAALLTRMEQGESQTFIIVKESAKEAVLLVKNLRKE